MVFAAVLIKIFAFDFGVLSQGAKSAVFLILGIFLLLFAIIYPRVLKGLPVLPEWGRRGDGTRGRRHDGATGRGGERTNERLNEGATGRGGDGTNARGGDGARGRGGDEAMRRWGE